ncbi:hypothetical protein CVT25_008423 [Psilocybe cyanescens]|uniref:Uncharacterized protein n=1 Tax=Psilocybe cyanescens TaxID=93625 RepID=A0A409WUR9_PSICY|nr:hypothetical protein CVT25_008423 [Psilocybe cyanescens]
MSLDLTAGMEVVSRSVVVQEGDVGVRSGFRRRELKGISVRALGVAKETRHNATRVAGEKEGENEIEHQHDLDK